MISLSKQEIAKTVMARIALRRHLHSERPQLLTDDHRSGLDLVIKDAFHTLCLSMLPFITDFSIEEDTDSMSLTMTEDAREGELRCCLEAALTLYTLHLLFSSIDPIWSSKLLTSYTQAIATARTLCAPIAPTSIHPRMY